MNDSKNNENNEEIKEQLIPSIENQSDEIENFEKNENKEENISENTEIKKEYENKEINNAQIEEEKTGNENEEKNEFETIDDRNWFRRTFGKMSPGALRGSIFSLSILSLGIGSLAIPQKIGIMGIILSPIFINIEWTCQLMVSKNFGKNVYKI